MNFILPIYIWPIFRLLSHAFLHWACLAGDEDFVKWAVEA